MRVSSPDDNWWHLESDMRASLSPSATRPIATDTDVPATVVVERVDETDEDGEWRLLPAPTGDEDDEDDDAQRSDDRDDSAPGGWRAALLGRGQSKLVSVTYQRHACVCYVLLHSAGRATRRVFRAHGSLQDARARDCRRRRSLTSHV